MWLKSLGLFLIVVGLVGCIAQPSKEYKGVNAADVPKRVREAAQDLPPRFNSRLPSDCAISIENGHWQSQPTIGITTENWDRCLADIEAMEREGETRRAEAKAFAEQKRQKRQQELEEYGPRFLDLYYRSKGQGVAAANKRLDDHDHKVRINSALMIVGCDGGLCQVDFPAPPRGSSVSGSSLGLLVKGIHTEPGRSLDQFRLVGFESYGYGPMQQPIAVFTEQ